MEMKGIRKTRLQRFVRDASIISATTIALLAIVEVALRILSSESEDIYRHHETYGMSVVASVRSKFSRPQWHGGETIWWETNSGGFRGDDLLVNPDMRVVVYGDSNVFAMFSELANTFTRQLAMDLTEMQGREVEVINAGTVGYGPDQNLLRFQQEAKDLKPDLVIFHVFADNDFDDIIRNRLFEIVNSELVPSGQPLVEDSYIDSEPSLRIVRMALRLRRALIQKVIGSVDGPIIPRDQRGLSPDERSSKIVVDLLRQRREEYEVYQTGAPRRFSYLSDEYDIDVALKPDSMSARTKVELMESVLEEVWALSRADEIPLMVLIQPSVSDLTSLRPIHATHLKIYPEYDPKRLTSLVEDICKRNGIPVLNLYDIFASHDPDRLYFSQDVHWNDAGQDLAASFTADYIQKTFLND